MQVSLSTDARAQAVASIKRYFTEQLDQEIGDLQAGLFLEFVLKEIAPSVYNSAVSDVQSLVRDRIADLDGECFVPEFGYWPRSVSRRSSGRG